MRRLSLLLLVPTLLLGVSCMDKSDDEDEDDAVEDTDTDTDADTDTDDCSPRVTGGDDSGAQYQLALSDVSADTVAGGGSVQLSVRMTNAGEDDSAAAGPTARTRTA